MRKIGVAIGCSIFLIIATCRCRRRGSLAARITRLCLVWWTRLMRIRCLLLKPVEKIVSFVC